MANLLALPPLLFPLITMLVSASFDPISIDCGAEDSFTDSNSIVWERDNAMTGESRTVQNAASVPLELSTLRVFSNLRKNCYNVKVDEGTHILVRATFHYGNYDNRSSPPTFDLQFDGNDWASVTPLLKEPVYYEAMYFSTANTSSICVAQTKPNQLPFISSLEVRALDVHMYDMIGASNALFLIGRYAYGAQDVIRYPKDAYDRIWAPVSAPAGFSTVSSAAPSIGTNISDHPPQAILQTAMTSTNVSQPIILTEGNLPITEVLVYINLYLSEVAQLDLTDRRWMKIDINGKMMVPLIIPPYASVVQEGIAKLRASSTTKISLSATSRATLPPLINAMEVFRIRDTLTNGTDSNDVEALSLLQKQFAKLQVWSGDPCLPATFNWEWVDCSSDATPRITALYLNGFQLKGSLPDFSAMDALEIIDMSNNSFNGVIPDFLGRLPNLKHLNLSDNVFTGAVPSSILQNKVISFDLSGNPNLSAPGNNFKSPNPETSSGFGSPPSSNETPQTSPSIGSSPSSGSSPNFGSSPSTGSSPSFGSSPTVGSSPRIGSLPNTDGNPGSPASFGPSPVGTSIPVLSSAKKNKLPVLLVAGNLSFLVLWYGWISASQMW